MADEFYELLRDQLRQGDIFAAVQFVRLEASEGDDSQPIARVSTKLVRGMLLNQSCDVDKPHTLRLVVVPVVNLSELSSADQTNVRKNKVFSRLHLPRYRDTMPESFVSVLEPMTVDRKWLQAASRLVSLSEQGRRALYFQYTRWLSRWELTEIPCPACGASFNPAQTLKVEND